MILLDLVLNTKVVISATGIIHNALANFTVVAICNASVPYLLAAPTTELVSWMAMAHHKPNSCCVKWSQCPIAGNKNSAIEFNMRITPKATEVWFSSDLIIGAIAAIALPPQIAVPQAIRWDVFLSIANYLSNKIPKNMVVTMEIIVKKKLVEPMDKALLTFIPKPNPTTDIWSTSFSLGTFY